MKILVGILTIALSSSWAAFADKVPASERVVPVAWSKFKSGPCTDPMGRLWGQILLNANKYALTTWWSTEKFDQPAPDGYLDFHGIGENNIRPVAAEAQGLAVSLRLGLYDPKITGVTRRDAERKTVAMIRSLVFRHRANSAGGWGDAWQSPYWAAMTAMSGWLLWDRLDHPTRNGLIKMVNDEAAWVMSNKGSPIIKTYRDRSGTIIHPGDTGSEENAWDATILVAATVMMPHSTNDSRWMNQVIKLELASFARPSDIDGTNIYAGKPLSEWLPGSNINEDGTAINHNILHPDYMVAAHFELTPINFYSLARCPTPQAALFNDDVVYNGLANLRFVSGAIFDERRIHPPGGTIFIPNSADVYYPEGDDWGGKARLNFAVADAVTALFSNVPDLRSKAEIWEQKHLKRTLEQQARFADGHTYLRSEFNYRGREGWVAEFSAQGYMLHWFADRNAVHFTNKVF